MPHSSPQPSLCPGTHLYLSSLAERIELLESGPWTDGVAHRLFVRRLRAGLAFHSDALLYLHLGRYRVVRELLEQRHFNRCGSFPGDAGLRAAQAASTLFDRLASL